MPFAVGEARGEDGSLEQRLCGLHVAQMLHHQSGRMGTTPCRGNTLSWQPIFVATLQQSSARDSADQTMRHAYLVPLAGLAAGEYGNRAVSSSADMSAPSRCASASATSAPEGCGPDVCSAAADRVTALLMRRMSPAGRPASADGVAAVLGSALSPGCCAGCRACRAPFCSARPVMCNT